VPAAQWIWRWLANHVGQGIVEYDVQSHPQAENQVIHFARVIRDAKENESHRDGHEMGQAQHVMEIAVVKITVRVQMLHYRINHVHLFLFFSEEGGGGQEDDRGRGDAPIPNTWKIY